MSSGDATSTNYWPGRRVLVLPGLHAQGSPPERAGYNYLGTSDNSQDGTLTRWIDAVTGCTVEGVEAAIPILLSAAVEHALESTNPVHALGAADGPSRYGTRQVLLLHSRASMKCEPFAM